MTSSVFTGPRPRHFQTGSAPEQSLLPSLKRLTSSSHRPDGAHRVFAQRLCFVLTDEWGGRTKSCSFNPRRVALQPRTSGHGCAVSTKSHKWANTTANASANRRLSVRVHAALGLQFPDLSSVRVKKKSNGQKQNPPLRCTEDC